MCMEFFGLIAKGMMAFADFIWGWPLLIGTSFVAVFLSVRLGFFQFAFFGHVMKNTFGKIFDKGSAMATLIRSRQLVRLWHRHWVLATLPAFPSLSQRAVPVLSSGCGLLLCWA